MTGNTYLKLLDAAHDRKLSGALNYRHIITPAPSPAPEEEK